MYQNELDEATMFATQPSRQYTDKSNAWADAVDLDPNEADDNISLTFELETSREEKSWINYCLVFESVIYGAIIDAKTWKQHRNDGDADSDR